MTELRFAITCRTFFQAISLFSLLGLPFLLSAEQTRSLSLNEILARIEANLNNYDTRVPSLFCDEHVISSYVEPRQRGQNTITDSVFRLKRTPRPGHTSTLVESHEIHSVDGKPATSRHLDGPTQLNGAFEGGLAVVSLNQQVCMKYELQRMKKKHPTQPLIVRFATALTPDNSAKCVLQEESTGRISIDPESMQITHLEITTPRHNIVDDSSDTSPLVGKRNITVDYASVLLGGETFWMPSMISMRVISGSGTFHPDIWSFQASYRNYHKLEVTSRILPASQADH